MGISVLKTVSEILKIRREIDETPLKNKNVRIMVFANIPEHKQYFWNRIFGIGWYFNKKIYAFLILVIFTFFSADFSVRVSNNS